MSMPRAYDIAGQFSEGFASVLKSDPRNPEASIRWLAGWDAGYGIRQQKHKLLNAYLASIGERQMGIVKLASSDEAEKCVNDIASQ